MSESSAVICDGQKGDPPVEVREVAPLLLRISEAARLLDVSERTAYSWAREGIIPTITLGTKRRVPMNLLEELIAQRCAEQTGTAGA